MVAQSNYQIKKVDIFNFHLANSLFAILTIFVLFVKLVVLVESFNKFQLANMDVSPILGTQINSLKVIRKRYGYLENCVQPP